MNTYRVGLLGAVLMFTSGPMHANDDPNAQKPPKIFGEFDAGYVTFENGTDDGFRANQASLGVKGTLQYGAFKGLYTVEVDFADLANPNNASDDNEARVRTARLVMPTKNAGVFVIGRSPSGQRRDLYGGVDIFDNTEIYNPNNGSYTHSNGLTAQGLIAPGVAAWVTPKMANTRAMFAALSVNDSNGESVDAKAVRVVYDKGGFTAGAGIVITDDSLLPTSKDYKRSAIGANYKTDKFQIGGVYENNKDHPSGDFTVAGLAGTFNVSPQLALKAGFFKKDHDKAPLDNKATIVNASYTFGRTGKNIGAKLYLEHEKHDIEANDKTSAGVVVKF